MKNAIYYLIFLATAFLTFPSCSSNKDKKLEFEEFENMDFGKGIYRPNPFKFCDNIPPFSWMGMPDSVKKETTFEISFNEDAIRSNSIGEITIVDINGRPVDGISYNGEIAKSYTTRANNDGNIVKISYTVNPEVGDSILQGFIVATGVDLDEANGQSIENLTPIANWELTHETGINWWRWIILILIVAIIILIIGGIIYGIVVGISEAAPAISISLPTFRRSIPKPKKSHSRKPRKKKKEEEEDEPKLLWYLKKRQEILRDGGKTTSQKAIALKEIKDFLDYDLSSNLRQKEEQFHLLDRNIQNALKDLAAIVRIPKNNGKWTSTVGNSMWVPDDDYIPENKGNYNNLFELTWKEIKRKYSIKGIYFKRNCIQLETRAIHAIKMPDFANFIYSDKRTRLHDEAFNRLAKKLGKSRIEVQEIKEGHPKDHYWKDYDKMKHKNYMWHEDIDCETLYLVPQEIHGNINHFGGVAMCLLLRKYGFI